MGPRAASSFTARPFCVISTCAIPSATRRTSSISGRKSSASARAASEGQIVFVDVTADWCFTCKVNERLVLETPEIAGAFEEHGVVPMKADWTNRNDEIGNFLAEHGRYGIPFYLLYRPGQPPHVFSELLTKEGLREAVQTASSVAQN